METKRSESIMNLAAALAVAQGQIKTARKDAKGNYSNYSTLDAIWDACRQPLAENGLSVVQIPSTNEGLSLETILLHSSGEWISGTITLVVVAGRMNEHQALGSALTYARKYALSAMVGIASGDDDDGELGGKLTESKQNGKTPPSKTPPSKKTVSPPPWLPTLDEFLAKARETFSGLTDQDIKDELKEAGFSGFKSAEGVKMMEALKKRKET
jgi:hypothetical protein